MIIYIAVVLTIHTIIGVIALFLQIASQAQHKKIMQAEIKERDRFFTELAEQIKGSEVEHDG